MYLICSLKQHLEMGLIPQTLLMFCSYLCIYPSSLHWASEPSHTCCPVSRNRLWIPCHSFFFFPKIVLPLPTPIMVCILLFFFSLPLSLLSPLNLVAGFGKKNKSFCCKRVFISVFINIYCYYCLLSCSFPLGIML